MKKGLILGLFVILNIDMALAAPRCQSVYDPDTMSINEAIMPAVGRRLYTAKEAQLRENDIFLALREKGYYLGLFNNSKTPGYELREQARIASFLMEDIDGFTPQQRESMKQLAKGEQKATKEVWGVATTPTDLVQGLTHWLLMPQQKMERSFNLKLDRMFRVSRFKDQNEKQQMKEYFRQHQNMDGLILSPELIDAVILAHQNAYYYHAPFFQIGGTAVESAIDPMMLRNASFNRRLKEHITGSDEKVGVAAAQEFLRFTFDNLQLVKSEPTLMQLFDLVKQLRPGTRAVVTLYEKHPDRIREVTVRELAADLAR